MKGTVHVFDFLENRADIDRGLCVIFGSDRFLKRLALQHLIHDRHPSKEDLAQDVDDDADEFAAVVFDSDYVSWRDVHDELISRSLFEPVGEKIVVVDYADRFVKENRERLEDYLIPPKPKSGKKGKSNPSPPSTEIAEFSGLLVLVVDSWASNTRLYKANEQIGLQIKCDPPLQGKSKNQDGKKITDWLVQRAKNLHRFALPNPAAKLIIDLTGSNFGRMDQELQKLALYDDGQKPITVELVQQVVGGWQAKTTWDAIDAATDGEAGRALDLLDRLLKSGEHPLALLGQISWSLRRYSQATEIVFRQVRKGQRADISAAIKSAGFPHWGGELAAYEQRLKRISSQRASQISNWLLKADMALKRTHSKEEAGRLVLETLLLKIAKAPDR